MVVTPGSVTDDRRFSRRGRGGLAARPQHPPSGARGQASNGVRRATAARAYGRARLVRTGLWCRRARRPTPQPSDAAPAPILMTAPSRLPSTPAEPAVAGPAWAPAAARPGEAVLAALLRTLERLAAALAAPAPTGRPDPAVAALGPLVCGAVAHLRAAGATPAEVVARLTAAATAAAPPTLPPGVLRARVAAVVAWCGAAPPAVGVVGARSARARGARG